MNRILLRSANGVLLVLCCFLAARIIASVAGEAVLPEDALASAPLPRGEERSQTWDERQVILSRNLFNVSTLGAAQVEPEEEDYEQTKLPLRLLGTAAAADPRLSRAAVEDLETRTHQVVHVGDRLKGQAEVVRIERRRLVLQNGPRREELALSEEPAPGPRPTASRASAPRAPARRSAAVPRASADIRRLGDNRFALPRADVESVADNPAALFSQARILPKYEEGEMVGVQLNAIKPGSLFEQIGIQNGDVITELNGIRVTGQQESAEVLRELSQATDFNVSVTGQDGATRELRYEVR
jgi:general secretion pathway protein C